MKLVVCSKNRLYVIESDLWGLLTEATSAKHQIILSDQTTTISTGTAIHINLLEF